MAKIQTQRGLKNYIQELRNCSTKEGEKERVDKELGKIRKKYTSDKIMSVYDKRKYMWKLLYTRLLGYEVEFGQKQAMDLLAAPGFAEKQVGYIACSIFLNEKDELLRLVTNSVRNDLISRNEAFQCLALDFIANVGGAEFASLLTADVMQVMTNGATRPAVRKKAALCLLRLLRKAPSDTDVMPANEWGVRMATLLEERDPGVLLGLTTLLLGVVSRNYVGYEACVPRLVRLLDRLKARDVPQDYTYYGIASPWLQVRVLRTLQYFPPPEDPALLRGLTDTVRRILAGNESVKNANKNNAIHAIVFEAVALAVGLGDPELLNMGVGILARFLSSKEVNLRYLALENLARLAEAPEVAEAVARHQKTVISCLQDPDISIRRRALDLVFATATAETVPAVVEELLNQLPRADYASREDIVLKAAVLAERFPPGKEWYVDSMLKLMESSGEAATDHIWQSVAQLITTDPALQEYAANQVCAALKKDSPSVASSEVFLRAAAFVLGEYGDKAGATTTPMERFRLLHKHFITAHPQTKALMLSAYGKMRAAHTDDKALVASIGEVLARHRSNPDADIQQRSIEHLALAALPEATTIALQPLPPWEKKKASLLLRRLAEREGQGEDEARELPAWLQQEGGVVFGGISSTSEAEKADEAEPVKEEAVEEAPKEEEAAVVEEEAVKEEEQVEEESKPNGGLPLIDLLDLSEPTEEPVQQPPSPAEPDALSMLADLSGPSLAANPFAETTTSPSAGPRPIVPIGDIGVWFRKLCVSNSGVLYEDANLQLGVKLEVAGSTATVGLYLGNKSRQVLQRVVCSVAPSPAFAIQIGAAVPQTIEPGRQVHIPLNVTCLAPFNKRPILQLGYQLADGSALATSLDLPLPTTKFCQPVDVPVQVFITRWNQVVGAPFKLSERLPRPTNATVSSVSDTLSSLHMKILQGADSDPECVAAACVLHCGEVGQPRQVPCMIKVSGVGESSGEVVVTVATADAMATDALKGELAMHISHL